MQSNSGSVGERTATVKQALMAAALELEMLASRLSAGEPLPNALLADAVESLREFADEEHHSECIARHEAARELLGNLDWALESLERGEAGAAGAFVISARKYVQLLREHISLDSARNRLRF